MNALSWLGNVSVGLLAAIAWDASPWGLALVGIPLGLLYVAYRGWMAQTVENELMEDIANAADEITRDGNLAMRLPMGDAAPRLAALTVTLNRMLERLEGSFLRQHHFMRDAAEELRQPVADAAAGRSAPPATTRRCTPSSTASRASSTTWPPLARADSPGFVRAEPTALAPFLEEVVASAGPLLGRAPVGDAAAGRAAGRHRPGPHAAGAAEPAAERRRARRRLVTRRGPRAVDEEDAWRFEVADEGGGVPAGHEDAIFEPFYRATPGSAGSGLGLALVRTVAGAHGGSAGHRQPPGSRRHVLGARAGVRCAAARDRGCAPRFVAIRSI